MALAVGAACAADAAWDATEDPAEPNEGQDTAGAAGVDAGLTAWDNARY
jgi:hypothetical protein